MLFIVFLSYLPIGVDAMKEQAVFFLTTTLSDELGAVLVGTIACVHTVVVVKEVVESQHSKRSLFLRGVGKVCRVATVAVTGAVLDQHTGDPAILSTVLMLAKELFLGEHWRKPNNV